MIVSQAQKVRSQLATLKKLEEDEKNRKDIEATYDELRQVASTLRQFNTLYQLIHSRLDSQQNFYIISQVQQSDKDIEASHQAFAQQRRQVKTLRDVKQKLESLNQSTEAGWKLYAEAQLHPQLELLKLVKQLPEILGHLNEINNLKERLEQFTHRSPHNSKELAEFDQRLQKLAKRLSDLNLEPAVKDFLNRVLRGEATLADLSEEILAWCQQGGRAKTFKITFR